MRNKSCYFLAMALASISILSGCATSSTSIEQHNTAPSKVTTETPTETLTETPTEAPTEAPTETPTETPTEAPTETPTEAPTEESTEAPTQKPTEAPTQKPTQAPTQAPSKVTLTDAEIADGYKLKSVVANGKTTHYIYKVFTLGGKRVLKYATSTARNKYQYVVDFGDDYSYHTAVDNCNASSSWYEVNTEGTLNTYWYYIGIVPDGQPIVIQMCPILPWKCQPGDIKTVDFDGELISKEDYLAVIKDSYNVTFNLSEFDYARVETFEEVKDLYEYYYDYYVYYDTYLKNSEASSVGPKRTGKSQYEDYTLCNIGFLKEDRAPEIIALFDEY